MEAFTIVKRIRAQNGISRRELADLAGVSPSTIGRIERGTMDPTWGTMQKILTSTGYRLNRNSIVSAGDTSALVAATAVFERLLKPFVARSNRPGFTTPWIDRWEKAGWISAIPKVDDLLAIGITAGNAAKVTQRTAITRSIGVDDGWRVLVERLQDAGISYAVSGGVATWENRAETQAGSPLIYVSNPLEVMNQLDLDEARPGSGLILVEALDDELDNVEIDNGVRFVPRVRALLDAFSAPGREPDKAEDTLRAMMANAESDRKDRASHEK